jgi:hypothetical protein
VPELSDTNPSGEDVKQFTLRLPPVVHKILSERAEVSGRSLNQTVVDACLATLAEDGLAEVTRERQGLIVQGERGEQAWAAVAYLLSYLGCPEDAGRAWPWTQQFLGLGGAGDLARAGALAAAEIDRWKEGQE